MSRISQIVNNVVNFYENVPDADRMTIQEAEAAINAYIAEVIGEDECPPGTVRLIGVPAFQRDQLRAEQRKRAGLTD